MSKEVRNKILAGVLSFLIILIVLSGISFFVERGPFLSPGESVVSASRAITDAGNIPVERVVFSDDGEGEMKWIGFASSDSGLNGKGMVSTDIAYAWTKEYIEVNASKSYNLKGKFKSNSANQNKIYFGFIPYDANFNQITSGNVNAFAGTKTNLYSAVLATDKIMKVADGSKWRTNPYGIVAFNVDNSGAYSDLPNFDISSKYGIKRVENKGAYWEIEFNNAIGKSYPAGASVREHALGSSYVYTGASLKPVPNDWTEFSGTINGESVYGVPVNKFWKGTKYVRVLIIPHAGQMPKSSYPLLIDDVSFSRTGINRGSFDVQIDSTVSGEFNSGIVAEVVPEGFEIANVAPSSFFAENDTIVWFDNESLSSQSYSYSLVSKGASSGVIQGKIGGVYSNGTGEFETEAVTLGEDSVSSTSNCVETDSGFDLSHFGTTTYSGTEYPDQCLSGQITEFACVDDELQEKTVRCASCSIGKCADPVCTNLESYNIDWRNTANWTIYYYVKNSKSSVSYNADLDALEIKGPVLMYSKDKVPIDANKGYYLEYDVMVPNNLGKRFYSGTISYNSTGGILPGHPGSYDYFGDVNVVFPSGVWQHRVNNAIKGEPRIGVSSIQSQYGRWHTGIDSAKVAFIANYQDNTESQTTYIKNIRFYELGC